MCQSKSVKELCLQEIYVFQLRVILLEYNIKTPLPMALMPGTSNSHHQQYMISSHLSSVLYWSKDHSAILHLLERAYYICYIQ